MVDKRDKLKEKNSSDRKLTEDKEKDHDAKMFTDKERKGETVEKQMRGGFE